MGNKERNPIDGLGNSGFLYASVSFLLSLWRASVICLVGERYSYTVQRLLNIFETPEIYST